MLTKVLYLQAGMIIDDEINRLLVNPLTPNVRLHAVIDACHSGTAMDLEYRCKVKHGEINWKMEYDHQPSVYKVRTGYRVRAEGSGLARRDQLEDGVRPPALGVHGA